MQIHVKAIEGRMVLDPRTIGAAQQHRIGYQRKVEGEKIVQGKPTPRVRFVFVGEDAAIPETRDGYLRKAILKGDLEYVEHVDGKRTWRDPALVRATVQHQKARAEAAAVAKAAAEVEAKALELELLAAAEGLTVEEYSAREKAKAPEAQSAPALPAASESTAPEAPAPAEAEPAPSTDA